MCQRFVRVSTRTRLRRSNVIRTGRASRTGHGIITYVDEQRRSVRNIATPRSPSGIRIAFPSPPRKTNLRARVTRFRTEFHSKFRHNCPRLSTGTTDAPIRYTFSVRLGLTALRTTIERVHQGRRLVISLLTNGWRLRGVDVPRDLFPGLCITVRRRRALRVPATAVVTTARGEGTPRRVRACFSRINTC